MPSSRNRRRVEIPTHFYQRLREIAAAEDRTITSVLTELLHSGLTNYQPAWVPGEHLDRFTQRARRALDLAQKAPAQFNHHYVGTEHLLLGLVEEGGGLAARALAGHGVGTEQLRDQIATLIGRGAEPAAEKVDFVPRVRRVLGMAVGEARLFGHDYIGTGHLLLALVREGEGVGARALTRLGVDLDRLRSDLSQALARGATAPADL